MKLETILNEIFMIDNLVDQINKMGDKFLDATSKMGGPFSAGAEVGKASLPNNKYWKAAQILATATGLAAPMAVYNLMNKARKGDKASQGQLDMMVRAAMKGKK